MSTALRERIDGFLREHHVMTLATYGETGPWAAAVFYAHDGLDLLFLSAPTSRHAQNLLGDPRAAITIQRDYRDWPEITGIQAEGQVSELAGDQRARARRRYGEKFPLVGRLGGAPAAIVEALARVHWYRFTPTRVYLIDNRLGFGHREALACGGGPVGTSPTGAD